MYACTPQFSGFCVSLLYWSLGLLSVGTSVHCLYFLFFFFFFFALPFPFSFPDCMVWHGIDRLHAMQLNALYHYYVWGKGGVFFNFDFPNSVIERMAVRIPNYQ
jgi:hypothetical protein